MQKHIADGAVRKFDCCKDVYLKHPHERVKAKVCEEVVVGDCGVVDKSVKRGVDADEVFENVGLDFFDFGNVELKIADAVAAEARF